MCVVELENNGRLVPSCSFPASPDMKIKTPSLETVFLKLTGRTLRD